MKYLLSTNRSCIVILLLTLAACKQNDTKNDNVMPGQLGEYNLKFMPSSITTDQNLKASLNNVNLPQEEKILSKETVYMDGQEYQLSVSEDNTTGNINVKDSEKIAATYSDLDGSIKYRLVVFQLNQNNSINEKIYDQALSANSLVNLGVYRNTKYKWIAYSYNNTTDPPAYPSDNMLNINPEIVGPVSNTNVNEFIYDSGDLTTSNVLNGSTPIVIQFHRKMATLRVVINAAGEFLEMGRINTSITANNNTLKVGHFDLFDGTFSSSSSYPYNLVTQDASNTYFQNYTLNSNHPTNWAKYVDYYIPIVDAEPLELQYSVFSIQTFKPKFANVPTTEIDLDTRTYNYPLTGKIFTFKSFTPEAGKRYLMKMDLVASGLALNSNPSLIWARDNLYGVRYNDGTWEYRFDHGNPIYHVSSGYPLNNPVGNINVYNNNELQYTISNIDSIRFMFTAAEAMTNVTLGDICKEVYPKNRWRLPLPAEYFTLYGETSNSNTENLSHYKVFPNVTSSSGSNSGYQQAALIFTTHGFINGANSLSDNFNGSVDYLNTVGYYRTFDLTRYARMPYSGGFSNVINMGIRRGNIRCVRNL